MKRKFLTVIVALFLAGCGSSASLRENSGTLATSILKTKTTAAELRTVNQEMNGTLSAPVSFKKRFGKTVGETEVSPSDFSDFSGFYENGVPKDANFPSLRYMEGSWKYYLDMQDLDTGGVEFNEFGFADVSLNTEKETVRIVLHPRMAGDGYELYPETEEEVGYEPFEGGFDNNGSLQLLGNDVTMYIPCYFAWSGREYVMGEIWYPEEGYWGLFLLTRGQE